MSHFIKILVSLDPAVTNSTKSDETGIIVIGKTSCGKGVVLKDLSGKYTPQSWADRAISAYTSYHAHMIIAEVNQGGDMVEHTLKSINPHIHFKSIRAKSGKYDRAIPVSALYRQGKIYHQEHFPKLEAQLLSLTPSIKKSPDRLDALVWGLRELFFENSPQYKYGIEYL